MTQNVTNDLGPNCVFVSGLTLSDDEERRVAFALAGFDVERDVISKFDRKLFHRGFASSKDDAIDQLFTMVERAGFADDSVLESVRAHEDANNSYFGNGLAIAHSETLHDNIERSFIAVLVSDTPFGWNGYDVDMAMLLVLHAEDVARFQIWNYLSLMISKPEHVEALRSCSSYQGFVETIRSIFKLTL